MQTDELEGLHAEPELSNVAGRMHLNSSFHFTPSQKEKKRTGAEKNIILLKEFQ